MRKVLVLFLSVLFLMSAKSCSSYDLKGNTVGVLYPQYGIARVRVVNRSCPLQVSDPQNVPMNQLVGWCVIPPEQCAQYTTDYEQKVCK